MPRGIKGSGPDRRSLTQQAEAIAQVVAAENAQALTTIAEARAALRPGEHRLVLESVELDIAVRVEATNFGPRVVYSEELGEGVARLVARGHTYSQVEKAHALLPRESQITQWRVKHRAFAEALDRARPAWAQSLLNEIVDVARASTRLTAGADKVRMDNLRWVASKLDAATFGDKPKPEPKAAGGLVERLLAGRARALAGRASPGGGGAP